MSDLLVGIDAGTSRLKVGIFDAAGAPLAFSQRECPPDHLGEGAVELDPKLWWQGAEAALTDCLAKVDRSDIRAIGVSSQAQSYVWIDEHGVPWGPAISWLDTRGAGQEVSEELSDYDFYEHTGWAGADPMLAVCKLRARTGDPMTLFPRGHLVFTDGYLIHGLCGEVVVSRNLAAMSGLYSLVESDWWQPALSCVEVPSVELPRILEIGEPAGRLHADLAEKWQIPRVPVVAGANDQTAAALGAGLSRPEKVNLGLGTAIVAYQVVGSEAPRPGSRPLRGPYVGGLDYQLTLHNTAGGVIEWARDLFADGADWERFFDIALGAEPGAGGLRLDPGFSTESGGHLTRLSLHHDRPHLLRAVLEGVACAARQKLDELDAPKECFATGAASANDRWMQMMADVTGRTIRALGRSQATLWGTALAAGAGAGVFEEILEAARKHRSIRAQFKPNPSVRGIYDGIYADYRDAGTKSE